MRNYFQFPRWDFVISKIPRDKRPDFRWLMLDETKDWCGDVEDWVKQGIVKTINRVYLYDRNTLFDHINWGGLAEYSCPLKVQLLPVSQFVDFADIDSLNDEQIEHIEDTIMTGWDDSQPTYLEVSELEDYHLFQYDEFQWNIGRHIQDLNYTVIEPCHEEQTIGQTIEALVEGYSGNPYWC